MTENCSNCILLQNKILQLQNALFEKQQVINTYMKFHQNSPSKIKVVIPDWDILKNFSQEQYWSSDIFSIPGPNGDYEFKLRVYPNDEGKNLVSVYMESVNAPSYPLNFDYYIEIYFGGNRPWRRSWDTVNYEKSGDDWGWPNCFDKNSVLSKSVEFAISIKFNYE